jgi:hypothetical protein
MNEGRDDEMDPTEELIEQYLLYLRGNGPLPGVPADVDKGAIDVLELVAALVDREPRSPSLGDDPVAIRLGLVGPLDPSDGTPNHGAPETLDTFPRVSASLDEIIDRFGTAVTVDGSTGMAAMSSPAFQAICTCTSLGESVALFVAPVDNWMEEPDIVAVVFRRHPELTAIGLTSADGDCTVILKPCDTGRSIDPIEGWVAPGSLSAPQPLALALGRYFDRAIPRWDEVARLDALLEVDAVESDVAIISEQEVIEALSSKPRLAFKKVALSSLRDLNPSAIASMVEEIQAGHLADGALLSRVQSTTEATAS